MSDTDRPDQIELVVNSAPIGAVSLLTDSRWPFPLLRPWLWPAWLVWRIKRGRSKERCMVNLPPRD